MRKWWKKGPKQETFRERPCLVSLQDRYVLVIGDHSEWCDCLQSVEYCEPGHAVVNDNDAFFRVPAAAGSTWTHPAPALPEKLVQCRAAELDGRVFVVGIAASECTRVAVFCPQMGVGDEEPVRLGGQWFLLSPESTPSSPSSNLVSHAGCLYLLGTRLLYSHSSFLFFLQTLRLGMTG
ncbi:unnamed protein product [Dibothriocephalus latus]|uniref:Uncharacterized protein n=1 Tax=Dibothriocephalus latus TaxID=60516 RepID=A0A3P6QHZ2_DIBLA|nr:unnamed protein product [Dibothriocephalus latus]